MPMIKANLSFSFGLHFCVYLLLYATLRLLHLKVAEILYSMHLLCFNIYTGYLVTNIYLSNSANMFQQFNTAFGSCAWLLQSPHCLIPILQHKLTFACTYSLVLGLARLFELQLDESTLDCVVSTECGHFGCVPASRYVVAFDTSTGGFHVPTVTCNKPK